MDLDKLATLFAEDARVTFGNEPPYVGVRDQRRCQNYRVFLDVTPIYV